MSHMSYLIPGDWPKVFTKHLFPIILCKPDAGSKRG
jgi:hypothetical protein